MSQIQNKPFSQWIREAMEMRRAIEEQILKDMGL